ncbi:FBXW11 isoform 10 [Pongo abelii]|uniref:FBXW11 isoform 10 n=1 Tax=Pongo abelii TaxID=9601 RepID=A0A2J8X7H0_PONAB|nr:FBXW11 isoform 4 [Pongo abelii]PNJ77956.1 FBXW11 isoform 8 [Pongo abelii]PNJ77958.1 FBXW11 isoform 10 [Pongo abelii]
MEPDSVIEDKTIELMLPKCMFGILLKRAGYSKRKESWKMLDCCLFSD